MSISQDFQISNFSEYTYSKLSHFGIFKKAGFDTALYNKEVNPQNAPVKDHQDLLVFAYIKTLLKPGSRILEVGGGNSRIIRHFSDIHECWIIDKLEGCGNGPTEISLPGARLVKDYMGNFNKELPDNYFDLVFSISALEHVPDKDTSLFHNIKNDISRVLKPGGLSLHCFDIVIKTNYVWTNKFLLFLFREMAPVNNFIEFDDVLKDADIFFMSKEAYDAFAKRHTKVEYEEFGKLMSYNILWLKSS